MNEPRQVKQVIVMRKDLNMRKGKLVAQGSHASIKDLLDKWRTLRSGNKNIYKLTLAALFGSLLSVFVSAFIGLHVWFVSPFFVSIFFMAGLCIHLDSQHNSLSESDLLWYYGNFRKICLSITGEAELMDLYRQCKEKGLKVHLIEDRGLTEFHGVLTKTCIAIGPHFDDEIESVAGKTSPLWKAGKLELM